MITVVQNNNQDNVLIQYSIARNGKTRLRTKNIVAWKIEINGEKGSGNGAYTTPVCAGDCWANADEGYSRAEWDGHAGVLEESSGRVITNDGEYDSVEAWKGACRDCTQKHWQYLDRKSAGKAA